MNGYQFSNNYENYLCDEQKIEKYKKVKKMRVVFGGVTTIAFFMLSFIFTYFALFILFHFSESFRENIDGYGFLLPVPFAIIIFAAIISIGFSLQLRKLQEELVIDDQKLLFHQLATGIQEFHKSNYNKSIKKLKYMSKNEYAHNLPNQNIVEYIKEYVEEGEEDEEYIEETFVDFVDSIAELATESRYDRKVTIKYILDADISDSDYMLQNTQNQEDGTSISYFEIILDLLPSAPRVQFDTNFWILYLVAASAGLSTVFLVDYGIGTAILLVLLTAVQLYDRRTQ